jgi:hypothetical protein
LILIFFSISQLLLIFIDTFSSFLFLHFSLLIFFFLSLTFPPLPHSLSLISPLFYLFSPCYLSLLYSGKTTQIPQFCADYAFPLENAPTTQNNGKSKNSNSDSKKRPHETEVKTENFEETSHQFQNELKSNEENTGNKLGIDINVSVDYKEISNERTAPSVSTVQPTRIVAVTQPRRVAAVTVAQRVAAERAGM